MKKVYIKTCPLCGNETLKPYLTCIDHYASGEAFQLCRCTQCGLIFTQSFPAQEEIGKYYCSPDYISHTDTHQGIIARAYHRVRNYMLKRKAKLVEQESHRTEGDLLDIGAGTGYFASYMSHRNWRVDGIEKSEQARYFAADHFGLQLMPENELKALPDRKYDVITLWHVMEHLEQLNETWEELNRLLKDRGTLIVAVPNSDSFDARHYSAYWAAYDVPRHIWHFNTSVMQRLGEKHGFILSARYPMPFDAFYISMLTEQRMRHRWPFLRGMLTGTLAWFSSLAFKDRSSSLIYVFRKKGAASETTASTPQNHS